MHRVSSMAWLLTVLAFSSVDVASAQDPAQKLPLVTPEEAAMDSSQLARMDPLIDAAIAKGDMPGCVVAIGRAGKLVWRKAYGKRQTQPNEIEMTTDTVFDLASLTKPIATATSVMKLV